MSDHDMAAVLVRTAGRPPEVGRAPRPDLATTVPPGFPIDVPQVPQRPPGRYPASLVAVSYAGVNPIDLHVASGRFFQGTPQTPYVPGVEGVGRIVESQTYPVGTRVRFDLGHPGFGDNGSMAEYVVADDAGLVELPDAVRDDDAAALGVAGITAGRALDLADVRPGDTVLVLGATGAIGLVAIQLARIRGAGRVVAAGRNRRRLERAAEVGADATVSVADLDHDEMAAAFRSAGGGGVDVIIDPLWGDVAMAALAAGRFGARLVNFGQAASTDAQTSSVVVRNNRVTIRGISTAMDGFDIRRDRYLDALGHLEAGRLVIDHQVDPMSEIAAVWAAQASSPGVRLLVQIASESG